MKTIIAVILLISFIFSQKNDMKTVEYVDIEQFMGKWYVIAIVPSY